MRWMLAAALIAAAPAPGPSPSAAPKLTEEALPLSYRKVLGALRERKEDPPLTAPLRFGRPERVEPVAGPSAGGPAPFAIAVRAVKQIEGEWAAFLDDDRRPAYPGDSAKGWKIIAVDGTGVTFQNGEEKRKVSPKPVRPPFPELSFNGMVDMPTGRVVLMKGRRDPVKVGDVIDGARVIDIQKRQVTVEFYGERRVVSIR